MSFREKYFLKKTSILKALITLQIHDKNYVLVRRMLFLLFYIDTETQNIRRMC